MIEDPLYFLVAIPAVLIIGIAKGGMGGGLGVLAVPMMSLAIAPAQAAAIMLPILCVMDLFGLWGFRGIYHKRNLQILIPASILGVMLGALTYEMMSEDHLKLLVGGISLAFSGNWIWRKTRGKLGVAKPASLTGGGFFGTLAGFTSFSVHAGGPPVDMYLLPQRLDKSQFVGTTIIFFAVVNYAKLIPYGMLGLLDFSNLSNSLILMPLAPLGIWLGMWMHHRVSDGWFYAVCYFALALTGAKLSYEGLLGLL